MDPTTHNRPSRVAENLAVAQHEGSARYDAAAKELVSTKAILAYILRSALDEYRDCSVEDIAGKYIKGEPRIGEEPVHQDYAGKPMLSGDERAGLTPTEDVSQTEGTIRYDIRFNAVAPKDDALIDIIVNCEVQRSDTPGYPILKRGMYYVARMLSAERMTEFAGQDYGRLKKAASIWICLDTSERGSDTITQYSFAERCVKGNYHAPDAQDYDLMTVVVMRLGRNGEQSSDDAIRLLSKLFSDDMDYDEKKDMLENEFRISMTTQMETGVREMCNLSEGVYERAQARAEAMAEAMAEAKAEAKANTKIAEMAREMKAEMSREMKAEMSREMNRNMAYRFHSKGMQEPEIAEMLDLSVDEVRELLSEPQPV